MSICIPIEDSTDEAEIAVPVSIVSDWTDPTDSNAGLGRKTGSVSSWEADSTDSVSTLGQSALKIEDLLKT